MTQSEIKILSSNESLSQRENDVLCSLINLYIDKATPIGSRPLAKYLEGQMSLSPATFRNIMADLEDRELITQPHTSAGRIPTDKGYRYYVNFLNNIGEFNLDNINNDKNKILYDNILNNDLLNQEMVYKESLKILSILTNNLAIIKVPHLVDLELQKIEIIPLYTNKILVVLALESHVIKTISLEIEFELNIEFINHIVQFLNDKLSGKTITYIKKNFINIINEYNYSKNPLIRLFVNSIDYIFQLESKDNIITSGIQNLVNNPEFEDINKVKSVIELVENENIIIHLLDSIETDNGVNVLIGSELNSQEFENFSFLAANYNNGNAVGKIGIFGPKRMNYKQMISLMNQISVLLSK